MAPQEQEVTVEVGQTSGTFNVISDLISLRQIELTSCSLHAKAPRSTQFGLIELPGVSVTLP